MSTYPVPRYSARHGIPLVPIGMCQCVLKSVAHPPLPRRLAILYSFSYRLVGKRDSLVQGGEHLIY